MNIVRKAADAAANLAEIAWYAINGYFNIAQKVSSFGTPTATGRLVNEYTALNSSVVFACVRIIAETIGSLPLAMYRRDPKKPDYKSREYGAPLAGLLHDEPNEEMTAMEFIEVLTGHAVSWGNAYARIVRRKTGAETIALWPLMPDRTHPARDKNGRLVYIWKDGNSAEKTFPMSEILHVRGFGFDGMSGYSVIGYARQSIAAAQAADEYAARFFASGGKPSGVLEYPKAFKTAADEKAVRESWNEIYGGMGNNGVALLQNGMAYKPISFNPEDMQLLATRQFSVPEICRWFRISPHMVADLSRATFSNIETLALEFVKLTLTPWLVRWEQAIKRCCMTPEEKRVLFVKFNLDALLRGEFATRMAGYSSALQNGINSINEVRAIEDENPIDGGDAHHIQLNMQDIQRVGDPLVNPALRRVSPATEMPAQIAAPKSNGRLGTEESQRFADAYESFNYGPAFESLRIPKGIKHLNGWPLQ